MRSLNLRHIKLRSGEEYRDEIELELEPFELGGERYLPVPDKVPAELAITKASTGTVLELGFTARLHGPCYRCLGDAVLEVPIAAREYQANNPEGMEELRTPYLTDDNLDLTAWSRDAVALALPEKILCRADCAGLCPMCGKNLNEEPHEHEEEHSDSRWSALEACASSSSPSPNGPPRPSRRQTARVPNGRSPRKKLQARRDKRRAQTRSRRRG